MSEELKKAMKESKEEIRKEELEKITGGANANLGKLKEARQNEEAVGSIFFSTQTNLCGE